MSKRQKARPIFGGDGGAELWRFIGEIQGDDAHLAVHALARRCRDLEAVVERLGRRVEELEGKEES